jgi:hypothetical protein
MFRKHLLQIIAKHPMDMACLSDVDFGWHTHALVDLAKTFQTMDSGPFVEKEVEIIYHWLKLVNDQRHYNGRPGMPQNWSDDLINKLLS